jgi:hypothetical protein
MSDPRKGPHYISKAGHAGDMVKMVSSPRCCESRKGVNFTVLWIA